METMWGMVFRRRSHRVLVATGGGFIAITNNSSQVYRTRERCMRRCHPQQRWNGILLEIGLQDRIPQEQSRTQGWALLLGSRAAWTGIGRDVLADQRLSNYSQSGRNRKEKETNQCMDCLLQLAVDFYQCG